MISEVCGCSSPVKGSESPKPNFSGSAKSPSRPYTSKPNQNATPSGLRKSKSQIFPLPSSTVKRESTSQESKPKSGECSKGMAPKGEITVNKTWEKIDFNYDARPQDRKTPVIKKSLAAIRDGDCYGELTFIYSTGDPTKMEAAEKETEKNESEGENEANCFPRFKPGQVKKESEKKKEEKEGSQMKETEKNNERKKCKYIKVNNTVNNEKEMERLLQQMKEHFELSFPQMLISVTGGAKDYKLDPEVSREFKKGITKAAKNKDVWITTGGTNHGVMSFLGQTIAELKEMNKEQKKTNKKLQNDQEGQNTNANKSPANRTLSGRSSGSTTDTALTGPTLIGFVPWSIVRERLMICKGNQVLWIPDGKEQSSLNANDENSENAKKLDILLNDNHTHFVFVDDNNVRGLGLGAEISLRIDFEDFIREEGKKRSEDLTGLLVGVLLEGGVFSLKTVKKALEKNIPVVIIEGSGRVADLIAFAIKNFSGRTENDSSVSCTRTKQELDDEIDRIFETQKKPDKTKEINGYLATVYKLKEKLTIFSTRDLQQKDLDEVLLRLALDDRLDKNHDTYKTQLLQLTTDWNCYATAADIIFNKKRDWAEPEDNEGKWKKQLYNIFWTCFQHNQHEFLRLLLSNCVTEDHVKEVFDKEVKGRRLVEIKNLLGEGVETSISKFANGPEKKTENEQKTKKKKKDKTDAEEKEKRIRYTCFFLLSIYYLHQETAKVFWERCGNYLSNLLLAISLYKAMADEEPYKETEIREKARDLQKITMEILELANEKDVLKLRELLIAKNSISKTHSVLGLADLAEHEEFIAHTCSQRVLDEVWFGAIRKERALKIFPKVWLGILVPLPTLWFIEYGGLGNILDSEKNDYDKRQKSWTDDYKKRQEIKHGKVNNDNPDFFSRTAFKQRTLKTINFYRAPITKFFVALFIYIVFLSLYTYVVLGELPEHVVWPEYMLATIILSFTTEELAQMITNPGIKKRYVTNVWNVMDICGILAFWIAFFLRMGSREHSKNTARIFYLFDLFFWFMKSLHFFNLSKELGPVVTIIFNMIPKLVRFSCVWIIFIASFGIVMKAIHQPKHAGDVNWYDMLNVISLSYWQVYGELFLEELDEDIHLEDNKSCTRGSRDESGLPPCPYWPRLSIYMLAVYLLIGNILLMNLLIAMFSSVYEEVNSRSIAHWKNKRMALIVEYHTRSPFPPPLATIHHLYCAITAKKHVKKVRRAMGLRIKQGKVLLERLKTFEEDVKDEYLLRQSKKEAAEVNRKVQSLEKQVEEVSEILKEVKQGQMHVASVIEGQKDVVSSVIQEKIDAILQIKKSNENSSQHIEDLKEQVSAVQRQLESLKTISGDVKQLIEVLKASARKTNDE